MPSTRSSTMERLERSGRSSEFECIEKELQKVSSGQELIYAAVLDICKMLDIKISSVAAATQISALVPTTDATSWTKLPPLSDTDNARQKFMPGVADSVQGLSNMEDLRTFAASLGGTTGFGLSNGQMDMAGLHKSNKAMAASGLKLPPLVKDDTGSKQLLPGVVDFAEESSEIARTSSAPVEGITESNGQTDAVDLHRVRTEPATSRFKFLRFNTRGSTRQSLLPGGADSAKDAVAKSAEGSTKHTLAEEETGLNSPKTSLSRVSHSNKSCKSTQSSGVHRAQIIRRLQAKLGNVSFGHKISAQELHAALQWNRAASDFTIEELSDLIDDLHNVETLAQATCSCGNTFMADAEFCRKCGAKRQSVFSNNAVIMENSDRSAQKLVGTTIMFKSLVEVLLADSYDFSEVLGEDSALLLDEVRSRLLAADVNCLVAELMNIQVDRLSANPSGLDTSDYFEPLVAVMILLNCVIIGIQCDPQLASLPGFVVAEFFFTVFFLVEIVLRVWYNGCYEHFRGSDWAWNCFDAIVVLFAIFGCVRIAVYTEGERAEGSLTIIRLVRLTRVGRLIRVFKVRIMHDLLLMIKGLLSGLRTLGWAVVMLFFILYVIGVFLTMLIGTVPSRGNSDVEREREFHFSTLPRSMFTAFRCLLLVDCTDTRGKPLLSMLLDTYGWMAPLVYTFCFLLVSIGVTNLIMAIYIENTLSAAKVHREMESEERYREDVRLARLVKALLVKFGRAEKQFYARGDSVDTEDLEDLEKFFKHDDDCDINMAVTRERFMLVLRDPQVQRLMDDLEVPPERARLFDVFDADGSGELAPEELVNGLLKVRGGTRKSDLVASFLAVRSMQFDLKRLEASHDHLVEILSKSSVQVD